MSSIAENDDVISSLPDTFLCHILSFLPTKQAVATSVLSKRWTHLWRLVPTINFEDTICLYNKDNLIRFNDFVYYVLLSRGSNSIKSFSLRVFYNNYNLEILGFPSVVKWVNHVVQHGVKSLDLFMDTGHDFLKLPISILTCRTLVVLRLIGFTMPSFSSVTLPSLKFLTVDECTFPYARDFLLFLAGCPILEDLIAPSLNFISQDSLTYQECESLDLRKLTRAFMSCTCHFPLKALHNVDELYIELNKEHQSFDEIATFHNLTKLELHSINSNWDLLVKVLNHCPNLQNLDLNEGNVNGILGDAHENWVDPKLVPQCLSLRIKTCTVWNFLGQQSDFLLAAYILKNARVLQTMEIICYNGLIKEKELSICPRASPTCELIFYATRLFRKQAHLRRREPCLV